MDAGEQLRQALAARQAGDFERVLELAAQALAAGPLEWRQEATAHRLRCWTLAQGLRRPGPQAILAGRWAVRAARRAQDTDVLADCLMDAALAAMYAQGYPQAERWCRSLIEMRLPPDPTWRAWANLGWMALCLMDYGAARGHARKAIELAPSAVEPRHTLALAEVWLGRPALALRTLRELAAVMPGGNPWMAGRVSCAMATAYVAAGRLQEAHRHLSKAMALATEHADDALLAMCFTTGAQAAVQEGHEKMALAAAQSATEALERAGRLDIADIVDRTLDPLLDRRRMAQEAPGDTL